MNQAEVIETLSKQLQLLAERSSDCFEVTELAALSSEMTKIAGLLLANS